MPRPVRLEQRDLFFGFLLGLVVFLLALPGGLQYGLTWDEPTYFRFARLQREWLGDLVSAPLGRSDLGELLSRERIAEVWLQDPDLNGHPPLNETWQAVVSAPFSAAGWHDTRSLRAANSLLFGLSICALFLLLRLGYGRWASLSGALVLVGVPAAFAHAHLGATETMQNFFWIALALVFPFALERGKGFVVAWLAFSALAFAGKFTNYLIPFWVLGTAGVLGAFRRGRFWVLAFLGLVIGPLLLLIFDPFFWPWQGGWSRFADYLGQVGSRGDWIPINVFYLGESWGFRPPWHYRIVETLAAVPVWLLVLALPGLVVATHSTWRQLRRQEISNWPAALGPSLLGLTLLVGWLPSTPNHDATRQFVFVFVGVALVVAAGVDAAIRLGDRLASRRTMSDAAVRALAATVRGAALALVLVACVVSLRAEPWGLVYRSEWLGGTGAAYEHGFEVCYWGEAIDGAMLREVAALREDGTKPYVLSIPKLNYFFEAQDFVEPLAGMALEGRERLADDAIPVYYGSWVPSRLKQELGPYLRLTFRTPPDGILFFHRRGGVATSFLEAFDRMVEAGDLSVRAETVVDGVLLARLYAVDQVRPVRLPFDPQDRVWFQPTWIADRLEGVVAPVEGGR